MSDSTPGTGTGGDTGPGGGAVWRGAKVQPPPAKPEPTDKKPADK